VTLADLQSAVAASDKDVIRSRLAQSILDEPDHRLALQVALVIAKVSRYEFPSSWPDAPTAFINAVRSSETPPLRLARALLALLRIVKELSTVKLQQSRQALQGATPEIVAVVGTAYARLFDSWMNNPNLEEMQLTLIAIKLLRRLLVNCYENPNHDQDVISFWSMTMQHLSSMITLRRLHAVQLGAQLRTLVEKHILQLAKLHYTMAKENATAFALLPDSIQLANAYWGLVKDYGTMISSSDAVSNAISSAREGAHGDLDQKTFDENIALKGLLLIRACVGMVHHPAQSFKHRTAEGKEEKRRAVELIKASLLTESFVRDALETVVFKLFVFRASELQTWSESAEEWEQREEGSGNDWEFAVRPCAEKLFLDLSINYKDIIVDPLLSVVGSITSSSTQDILFKDSIYSAVGLSAAVLQEKFDFDAFIRDVLVLEVQKQSPGCNILRRRVAIVLGQWIGIRVAESSKTLVYEIFQHLLDSDDVLNDPVVRITAGRHLANVANDWEFQPEQFLPYATNILTRLLRLINEVELPETKLAIVNTVSVIVERLDHQIVPYAEGIVNLLPSLWEQSEDEHLMRQAILTILTRLINAMRSASMPLHSMVLPIIGSALQPNTDESIYLLEDALELLGAVLAQTPDDAASPELLALLPRLYPIFELGTETLGKALEITESYLLLAPSFILSDGIRLSLLKSLTELFGEVKAHVNGPICTIIEGILRAANKLGGEPAIAQVASDLIHCGLLPKLLSGLHASWTAHCTTGPRAKTPLVDGIVETEYFSILARLLLGSATTFCRACVESTSSTTPLEETMKWLLEELFSHFQSVSDPSRRKLLCLAATQLLSTNQPFILGELQSLMTIWTDVITELREDDVPDPTSPPPPPPSGGGGGGNSIPDCLVYDPSSSSSNDINNNENPYHAQESPEDTRRRHLTQSDEVHTLNTAAFVRGHLGNVVAQTVGGEAGFRERWVDGGVVDGHVLAGFMGLGVM
jgi:hypothetical protein